MTKLKMKKKKVPETLEEYVDYIEEQIDKLFVETKKAAYVLSYRYLCRLYGHNIKWAIREIRNLKK